MQHATYSRFFVNIHAAFDALTLQLPRRQNSEAKGPEQKLKAATGPGKLRNGRHHPRTFCNVYNIYPRPTQRTKTAAVFQAAVLPLFHRAENSSLRYIKATEQHCLSRAARSALNN